MVSFTHVKIRNRSVSGLLMGGLCTAFLGGFQLLYNTKGVVVQVNVFEMNFGLIM